MKKFFTLIAAVVACLSVNAEEITVFEGSEALGWGGTKLDFSALTATKDVTLKVTVETDGGWWQYKFCEAVEGWPSIALLDKDFVTASDVTYSWSAGEYTQSFDLTETQITQLKSGIYVQGSGATVTLKKVVVATATKYQEAVDLTGKLDQYGQILASEFNGFSDDAKVVFTYNVEGLPSGKTGWGAGALQSLGGAVDTGEYFPMTAEGENSVSHTVKELTEALNTLDATYNRYGLYWNMWSCGDGNTNTRVSLKVYEVEGFSGDGYKAPDATTTAISEVAAPAAAQKVVKAVKNGKVVIVKDGAEYNVAGQLVK